MSTRFHQINSLLIPLCSLLPAILCMRPTPAIAATRSAGVIISAVQPNPSNGPEWIMIEFQGGDAAALPHQIYLPVMMNLIASVMPISTVGQPPTLSIANIAGWRLGNNDVWYTFPDSLPPLPAGAKVIVYYDGLGESSNSYDFSGGTAELHTPAGMVNVLPDSSGKVFLYAGDANTPENLRAQYEWGVQILD